MLPAIDSQDVSPLEALRSKPKASFNKSFRKADKMLQESLEELEAAEGDSKVILQKTRLRDTRYLS